MNRIAPLTVASAVAALLLSGCSGLGRTHRDQLSYDVTGTVTALTVHGRAGRVTVVAGEGPVKVVERYSYTQDRPLTSHRTEGTMLVIEDRGCPGRGIGRRCGTDFEIVVPAATAVTIDNDAGEVTLRGLTARVDVRVDAGSVTGTDLRGPAVVHSDAGEIELRFSQPPTSVETTTDTGSTRLYLPASGHYAIETKVGVGSADVKLPSEPSAPNKVSVRTDVGEVLVAAA